MQPIGCLSTDDPQSFEAGHQIVFVRPVPDLDHRRGTAAYWFAQERA